MAQDRARWQVENARYRSQTRPSQVRVQNPVPGSVINAPFHFAEVIGRWRLRQRRRIFTLTAGSIRRYGRTMG